MSPDHELKYLRRRRQADEATIDALASALAKMQRAARALKEENAQLRHALAERQAPAPWPISDPAADADLSHQRRRRAPARS